MTTRPYMTGLMGIALTTMAASIPAAAQTTPTAAAPPATGATTPANPAWVLRLSREGSVVAERLPDMNALRERVLANVWKSEAGKKAMRDLGLSEQAARDALEVKTAYGSRLVQLVLTLPRDGADVRRSAKEFMDEAANRIVVDVVRERVVQFYRGPVDRAEEAVSAARAESAKASEIASKQRQAVRDAAQVLDPSPDAVRAAALTLDQERQKITLELAGQAARQRALEERVAKLSDAAAAKVSKDEIAAELEKIVQLREREAALHAQLQKSGGATETSVGAAQAAVAEARARLLERREAAARSAGSDLLGDLNKELVTLTITIAENEARLKYVENRLDGLGRALERVDDFEQALAAAARARRQQDDAEQQLRLARLRLSAAPESPAAVGWNDLWIETPGDQRGGGSGGGKLFGK